MSHITVCIVTKEKPTNEVIRNELIPFMEFAVTGENTPYIQHIDILKDAKEDYAENKLKGNENRTFKEYLEDDHLFNELGHDESPDIEHDHRWGWYRTDKRGRVVEIIKRTNPNATIDDFRIGGRYGDRIFLKNSRFPVNSARKSDIDFDKMIAKVKQEYPDELHSPSLLVWAILKDGVWYSKGENSWVDDSLNPEWRLKCNSIIDSISDDHYLTILDCIT